MMRMKLLVMMSLSPYISKMLVLIIWPDWAGVPNVIDSLEDIMTITSLNLQVKFSSIYENELKKNLTKVPLASIGLRGSPMAYPKA
jgi:hypothetical protein